MQILLQLHQEKYGNKTNLCYTDTNVFKTENKFILKQKIFTQKSQSVKHRFHVSNYEGEGLY